ncbi:MAG: zinc transporter ZntB [Pseudomonadota bacterium]
MEKSDLSRCFALDGEGGAEAMEPSAPSALRWLRFDFHTPGLDEILRRDLKLDALVVEALLAEETRPRCRSVGDGALLILRGVNLNPGADPEDMVSLRVWVDAEKLVSVQLRRLFAVGVLEEAFRQKVGPKTTGELSVAIAEALTERMQPTIEALEDRLDALEDAAETGDTEKLRREAADLGRTVVTLRRYIAPQRDALETFVAEVFSWQTEGQERLLKDIVDRITRLVEQLDEIRARSEIFQDGLAALVAEKLNRTMFLLSVVAGIFLPISFLTGLLGINVGGMPGVENGAAFWIVVGIVLAVTAAEIWLFRKFRLF